MPLVIGFFAWQLWLPRYCSFINVCYAQHSGTFRLSFWGVRLSNFNFKVWLSFVANKSRSLLRRAGNWLSFVIAWQVDILLFRMKAQNRFPELRHRNQFFKIYPFSGSFQHNKLKYLFIERYIFWKFESFIDSRGYSKKHDKNGDSWWWRRRCVQCEKAHVQNS